jgi:hypothetical protein
VFENFNHSVKGDHPRIVPAMRNLAWCYEYGVGTEVDEVEAEKWEARAGEAGLSLVDGTTGDSRMSRALSSGLVLLGWIGFLMAARGIWRGRLDKLSESSREQTRSMAYFDVVTYAKIFFERFETLLIFAVFLGLTWTVYCAGIPPTRIFFLAMVIGLPASALLLFISGRLGWDPFQKFDYHRGGDMSAQRSDSTQFHLIVRKLPLLFILSLLLAQFVPLAWGVLFSICLVGIICSRDIDVLPQLDIWPGPNCKFKNHQTIGWFFRRTPLHITYLLVFFTLGWVGLIVCALLLETPYTFSTDPLRRYFVIIKEKEPPRLAEKTADMISRRMRYSPAILSCWWALWVTLLIYGAVINPISAESVEIPVVGFILVWLCMGVLLKQMRGEEAVFRSFPWIIFVSWVLGMGAAIVSVGSTAPQIVGINDSPFPNPYAGFITVFGAAMFLGVIMSGGSFKLMKGSSLGQKLLLSSENEVRLIGLWRVKSPHLLFTAGCIGMLLALGSNMLSGENLRHMIIGTFGIGLLIIVAIGAMLLKFDVKLLPEKQMEKRANPYAVANRYFWGALAENAFFIFGGAMVLAWLINPWQDIGGFDYYWARVLFLGLPVMCLGICAGVRFPVLQSSLLIIVMIGLLGLVLLPKYYSFQEYMGGIPEGLLSLICILIVFFFYFFFPNPEALGKRVRRYFIGVFASIRVVFESLRHVPASGTVPKPWINPTVDGLQVRWGMLLTAGALVVVLLASAGIWVYGEKRVILDVIELSGNSYILLESGFLMPADSLP